MINKVILTVAAGVSALLPPLASAKDQPSRDAEKIIETRGAVQLDLVSGRVSGQVCLSNRAADVAGAFALNAGLNVARVTDGDGKGIPFDGWYEPGIDGEARIYTLSVAPAVLCVQYVGAFPVYPAHDGPEDFKGVMAFNGDSARFAEQSAWLPTPFDVKAKTRASNAAYDLEISCDGCRVLYVNGSAPVMGERGRFSSRLARPPLLFGGRGPVTNAANVTILNESVPTLQADALSANAGKIAAFYQGYMGQPLTDQPAFLRMVTIDQVERDRAGGEWAFATWPTIAMSGSVGNIGTGLLAGGKEKDARIQYLAHEMGHYYFGTLTRPSGPYFWFTLESTAEFLSVKALQAISGKAAADAYVAALAANVTSESEPFVRLDQVTDSASINGTYRYFYGPLLLLALEKRVGETKMRAFMRGLFAAPQAGTWADLEGIARKAGISSEWEQWRATCVADVTRLC